MLCTFNNSWHATFFSISHPLPLPSALSSKNLHGHSDSACFFCTLVSGLDLGMDTVSRDSSKYSEQASWAESSSSSDSLRMTSAWPSLEV